MSSVPAPLAPASGTADPLSAKSVLSVPNAGAVGAGKAGFLARIAGIRERLGLPSPGSFENLHREVRGLLPAPFAFDGAKVDLTSMLSQCFQVSHSLTWASAQYPNTYNFSGVYAEDRVFMQGTLDSDLSLTARVNYAWTPMPQPTEDPNNPGQYLPPAQRLGGTTKLQAQLATGGGNSMVQVEHDHVGSDYSINFKAANFNLIDKPPSFSGAARKPASKWWNSSITGIFVASYLQSVTPNLALGGEFMLQKPLPEVEDQAVSLVARYSSKLPGKEIPPPAPGMPPPPPLDPSYTLTATYQPGQGVLHVSYFHRLNQRAELGSELQALIGGGQREAVATVGFKVDTLFATIRGSVDTRGKVQAVMEERMAQGLALQLSGEMDYAKGQGGAGKVGVGFALEV